MSRRFGITGGMASGKTTLANEYARHGLCRVVEVDDLRRHALWASEAPRHRAMRAALAAALGLPEPGPGRGLDRAAVAARAFSGRDAFEAYAGATAPTLREDALAACAGEGPPAAIVWARLVEDGYAAILNGPIGVVTCPPEVARARIAAMPGDPLAPAEAERRMALLGPDADRLRRAQETGAYVVDVPSSPRIDPCAFGELLVHFTDLVP